VLEFVKSARPAVDEEQGDCGGGARVCGFVDEVDF
jgi:hypothetical protein